LKPQSQSEEQIDNKQGVKADVEKIGAGIVTTSRKSVRRARIEPERKIRFALIFG